MKKTSTENTLLDYSGGIFSLVPDEFKASDGSYDPKCLQWTRGKVGWNFAGQSSFVISKPEKVGTTNDQEVIVFKLDVNQNATNFKERMIKDYDTTNKEAVWMGYCNTKQNVSGSVAQITSGQSTVKHPKLAFNGNGWAALGGGTGTETDPYKRVGGYILYAIDINWKCGLYEPVASDRKPLNQKDVTFYHECFYDAQHSGHWYDKSAYLNTGAYDGGTGQQIDIHAKGATFTRTIVDTNYDNVIVCDNDTKYEAYRFSDNDLISGWCTETEDKFKTGLSFGAKSHNSMMDSGALQVSSICVPFFYKEVHSTPIYMANGEKFEGYVTTSDTTKSHFLIQTVMRTSAVPSGGDLSNWKRNQLPYFGFMPTTELDDWRQLSTNKYDAVLDIDTLKSLQKEGPSTVYTNATGTHLMLGAGVPVIKLEKNCKYTLTFKIENSGITGENDDYYLWLKDGTFTKNKKPQNESNLFTIDGLTKDAAGYILPVGTSKSVTIEIKKDGYLFCKWRNKDMKGGGNLKIERSVTKTTND